jgi:aquaporin NIP
MVSLQPGSYALAGKMVKMPLYKKMAAEAFGTFWILFAGTGAIIIGDINGVIPHLGVALVFGLIVFAMISALGDVSGAHFNPAVTLAFFASKRLPGKEVLPFIISQIGGAILGSAALRLMFPDHTSLGITRPTGSLPQAWMLEFILTTGLMFVIMSVSTGAKEKGITAGLAIGSFVGLAALFAGPISGASMNPARSLAPALVSGHLEHLWIYLTAPVLGALLSVVLCAITHDQTCCSPAIEECNQ